MHAISAWRVRPVTIAIAAAAVAVAPFTLIDPNWFYNALAEPSLVALWVSQLIVFAVYPLFAVKHGGRRVATWPLAAGASAFAVYGIVTAIQQAGS